MLDHEYRQLSSNLTISDIQKLATCCIEDKCKNKLEDAESIKDKDADDLDYAEDNDDDFLPTKDVESDDNDDPLSLLEVKYYEEIQVDQKTKKSKTLKSTKTSVVPAKRKRSCVAQMDNVNKIKYEARADDLIDTGIDTENNVTVGNRTAEEQLEKINKRKQLVNYLNSRYKCNLCLRGFIEKESWKHQTHSALVTIDDVPPYACYECAALLKKFYIFRKKCLRSYTILKGLLNYNGEIKFSELNMLDRNYLQLSSNLTMSDTQNLATCCIEEKNSQSEPKDEKSIEDNDDDQFDYEEDNDDVYLSTKEVESSDNDDSLSLLKVTDYGEIEITRITKNSMSEPIKTSLVPVKRKRGPRARMADVKHVKYEARADHDTYLIDNGIDTENYVTVINLTPKEQIQEMNKRRQSASYLNSRYKCNLCYRGFIDTEAWNHHLKKHSTVSGDHECPLCKLKYKKRRYMRKHFLQHQKKYACKLCDRECTAVSQAKQHQDWHKGVTYTCKLCDNIFAAWSSYMNHMRKKHPSDFICAICGYSFISKLGLSMHKTMMHIELKGKRLNEDGPYCEECDVKFVSKEAYNRHMVMSIKHTGTTNVINGCRTCGERFVNKRELRLHQRKGHPENYEKNLHVKKYPTKCEHCSEVIPNGRKHWFHYRSNHPNMNYPIKKNLCNVCGKTFTTKTFLECHKRTHNEERAFKCDLCDKAFFNQYNLTLHQRAHTESRPWLCNVCPKAFKDKGALTRHIEIHTGLKPYQCEICGQRFSQPNGVKGHIAGIHHREPSDYTIRRMKNPYIEIYSRLLKK